ncbi:dynamin GTPase [Penicillium sp. DV-2018c]|nr:dynamin GTPase [Penicillium sp. DV-2018c]
MEKLVTSIQQRVVVDMTEQACSEAQNDLNAYYKVAMKTFVDNICRQVIERHIIAKLPSVFEPVLVSGYETEELLRMAAESAQVSARRDEARHFQKVLEKSLEDLSL